MVLLGCMSLLSLIILSQPLYAQMTGVSCEEPNILLILDHSGSMNEETGGSSKWDQAIDAINQVTFGFDQILRFGLMYFPTRGDCDVDLNRGLLNDVAPANGGNIRNSLSNLRDPDGGTPLARSVQLGATYFDQLNDQGRENIIVAITDGEDTCNGNPVRQARLAYDGGSGYKVYVIGFGGGVDGGTLRRMAQEGGTNDYFQANNASELFEALRTIANQASAEECDGADNDCDGIIDEDIEPLVCETMCGLGERICIDGQLDSCRGGEIPVESCDGTDNDCDGIIDEGDPLTECLTPSDQPGTAECLEGGVVSEDCNPNVPENEEICDGIDNDSDGIVDENTSRDCQYECHYGRELCIEGQLRDCSAAPVVEERCNGFDDDCDGLIDEMVECVGQEICGEEGQCLLPCQNDECFPGFVCLDDGYCHPFPCDPECPEGRRCIDQECVTPCLANAQCTLPNEICDADAQRCIPDPNASSSGGMSMGGSQMGGSQMGGQQNGGMSMGGMNQTGGMNQMGGNQSNNMNPSGGNNSNLFPPVPPLPSPEGAEMEEVPTASCATPDDRSGLWTLLLSLLLWIHLLKRDHVS